MLTVTRNRRQRWQRIKKSGSGIVNSLINKLPFELHLPGGYQYCGPGTKLHKRLARGDPGINGLDRACRQHDIAYLQNDLAARHKADSQLEQAAWNRVRSKDASIGEKTAAWLVTNIMKGKQRLGMGCTSSTYRKSTNKKKNIKKKKIAFGSGLVDKVRTALRKAGSKKCNSKDVKKTAEIALQAARRHLKFSGGKRNIRTPRIIPLPKVGGILPLIPIFAGLSALGSLAGGAASIVKAVRDVKASSDKLANNTNIGQVSMGKTGKGIYLKPYRKGLGLYLKPKISKNF